MALPWDQLSRVSAVEALADSCVLLHLNLALESPGKSANCILITNSNDLSPYFIPFINICADLMLEPSPAVSTAVISTCDENPSAATRSQTGQKLEEFQGKKAKFESMILAEHDQASLDHIKLLATSTVYQCLLQVTSKAD